MAFNELEHLNLRPDSGDLSRRAVHHRTDKSWHNLTSNLNYLDVYEPYLIQWRDVPISILEIGVRDGASLRMWQDYFRKASRLVGLDIDPQCAMHESPPIHIRIGDQCDAAFLDSVIREFGSFDLIIDDGSHNNRHIVSSFERLWPAVAPGGIYIIEDLDNSYGARGRFGQDTVPAAKRITWKEVLKRSIGSDWSTKFNRRALLARFFERLVNDVDNHQKDKLFVHFWDSLCIVKKAASPTRPIHAG